VPGDARIRSSGDVGRASINILNVLGFALTANQKTSQAKEYIKRPNATAHSTERICVGIAGASAPMRIAICTTQTLLRRNVRLRAPSKGETQQAQQRPEPLPSKLRRPDYERDRGDSRARTRRPLSPISRGSAGVRRLGFARYPFTAGTHSPGSFSSTLSRYIARSH
jgi:hypothetical protein